MSVLNETVGVVMVVISGDEINILIFCIILFFMFAYTSNYDFSLYSAVDLNFYLIFSGACVTSNFISEDFPGKRYAPSLRSDNIFFFSYNV